MIRYVMQDKEKKRKILGIILSAANIENLILGYPVHIFPQEMGLLKFDFTEILIDFCIDEEEATKAMVEAGVVTEDTIIRHNDDFKQN